MTLVENEMELFKRRWESSEEIRGTMNGIIQKQITDIAVLRVALKELADEAFKNMSGGKGHLLITLTTLSGIWMADHEASTARRYSASHA